MAKWQGPMEGMGMNREFWQGKRVFLTGHTGFKGSWLSLWLQQLGAQVTGYALEAATEPSLFKVAKVGEGMTSVIGDVRDFLRLQQAMQIAQPEIVIHLAAQPLVLDSYANPLETYSTNVMGTVHLLEAIRHTAGVRAVVNVTSDKCYENREWAWGYRENEPMGGYDPYSSSKGCAELVTSAYRNSYFNPQHGVALASARAGNVIGGGDWAAGRLLPDILRALAAGEAVAIRHPQAIRPWQHVLEPICGYLALAQALYEGGADFAEAWNFGPADDDAKPVEWVVEQFITLWGKGASYQVEAASPGLHEAHYLKLDCSKARMKLHWQPRWPLRTALEKICQWQQAYLGGQDMREFTCQQINTYLGVQDN